MVEIKQQDLSIDHTTASDPLQLSTGLGIKKGRALLDLYMDIGNWNGLVTGPTLFAATLTVNFGAKKAPTVSAQTAPAAPVQKTETQPAAPEAEAEKAPEPEAAQAPATETATAP